MSWKEDKDLGPVPWNFVKQPDKWGYLNNPRWTDTPEDPVSYSDDPGSEPQVWTPPDGSSIVTGQTAGRHLPCGHWHRGISYGPGEDLYIACNCGGGVGKLDKSLLDRL